MLTFIHRARITGIRKPSLTRNQLVLVVSISIQVILALLFGHHYDMRIFMATGYLVGSGQNPYIAQDLTTVFNNSSFQGMTSVGYFPPWPLILGFVYQTIYQLVPNIFVYNLVIKIPVIAANILLAFLVADILKKLEVEETVIWKAWVFLLINPFLLYFSSAWGQFDSIVALLSLSSLVLLYSKKPIISAILLALAISLKPIALPILPVSLVYLMGRSLRQTINYTLVFFVSVLLFCVAPFLIFGWDPSPILRNWNAHFTVGGGMSFFSFFELLENTYQLPGWWWLLGLAWVPALLFGILALKDGIDGFVELLMKSTGLIMVFFLTRTWLSEPNITLILPLVLILTLIGKLNRISLLAVWALPLIFTIFNTSPPQLLFPAFPEVMDRMLVFSETFRTARLVARTIIVIPWLIIGWWIVISCFKRGPALRV
jgi:hypothetical protein